MSSLTLEKDFKEIEDKIIKDVRILFGIKKEINNNRINYVRNLFRL